MTEERVAGHVIDAFIGLGANLGDRLANLTEAVRLLDSTEGVRVMRSSRVYETGPVGPPQPDYLNAVAEIRTSRGPRELLSECQEIERRMGRIRGERWGSRVIDLDVLTYDREVIDEPGLRIPHPRMHERGFVLVPLLELTADPHLPNGRTLAGLSLPPSTLGGVRLFGPSLPVG